MLDTEIGRKQLSSKGTVSLLGRLKGLWVPQVLFFILAGDEHAVNEGTPEVKTTQDAIDEALEGLLASRKPNGIQRNSNEPNGVEMAVFGTSPGTSGIWGTHVRGRWSRKRSSREDMRHSHGCAAGGTCQG